MPQWPVDIVLGAKNNASGPLKQVNADLKETQAQVKEVGGASKASTELVGSLAQTMGGGWAADAAGQVAMVTERVTAFSEIMKAGTLGAQLFKAGLVGVAAVGVARLTLAINEAVSGSEDLINRMERIGEEAQTLNARLQTAERRRFDQQIKDLELLDNRFAKAAEANRLLTQAQDDYQHSIQDLQAERAKLNELEEQGIFGYQSSTLQAAIEQQKQQVALAKARSDAIFDQRRQLQDLASEENQLRENRRKELALRQAQQDEIRQTQLANADYIDALQRELDTFRLTNEELREREARENAVGQATRDRAVALLAAIDAEKEALQLAKEKEAEEKRAADEQQRLIDRQNQLVENLKIQALALTEGKEAARAYALELQGIDKETARQIAATEARLEKLREAQEGPKESKQGPLAAVSGRLLSGRGLQEDAARKNAESNAETARNTKEIADIQKQLGQAIRKLSDTLPKIVVPEGA